MNKPGREFTPTRREMLKGMLALGGLAVTCRAQAAPEPAGLAVAVLEKKHALSIAYAHVKAGASAPFSVFHISDSHLADADADDDPELVELGKLRMKTFGGYQKEALHALIARGRQCSDLIVHTGDLLDFVSEGNLRAAKEAFALGGGDVFGSIGNHEWRGKPGEPWVWGPEEENRQACAKIYPYKLDFDSRILNGVNFVSLDDSLIDAKGDFRRDITPVQRERFEKEVAKGLPIVLCVHVPFWTPDVWMASRQYWKKRTGKFCGENTALPVFGKGTEDFIAYLKSEPLLKAILSGHEHITVEERFSPTAMQYLISGSFSFTARHVLFT